MPKWLDLTEDSRQEPLLGLVWPGGFIGQKGLLRNKTYKMYPGNFLS